MKNLKGSIAMIVAAVLVILGLVLPFYSVDISGVKESASLFFADGISIVGVIWLIFTLLAVLFAFIGKKVPTVIFGILSGLGMLLSFFANTYTLADYEGLGELVDKGAGYYFTIIGAIVIIIAAIFYAITTKKED